MSILTAEAVEKVFNDCLFGAEEVSKTTPEPPEGAIIVDGIVNRFGFNLGRLESHREEVKAFLAELPDGFQEGKGGGWSFLQACMTRDGNQWGEHRNMEQLFVLAIGLKLARWQMPREMWRSLPGGMPYVVVQTSPIVVPLPCELCGAPTLMTGTKRCDCCYELEGRIRAAPELAQKILANLKTKPI